MDSILARRWLLAWAAICLTPSVALLAADDIANPLAFTVQDRVQEGNEWQIRRRPIDWEPSETCVVVCDMWDSHHSKYAALRCAELAPRMNAVIKNLRDRGCFVIHCPSDTMEFYKDHPGRKLAHAAKPVETKIPLERWCRINVDREGPLPIDDSDGGDDTPADEQAKWQAELKASGRNPGRPWTRQIETIEIRDGDAITDSAEAYYLMRERGIKNVIVMGVHTNMCVLGRPFSIRQMVYQGQNVLLVRDMTDAMYNPAKAPNVNHFRGKELVVEHIERHWCPTITSADVLGDSNAFVHATDKRPHLVFIIGEDEYKTERTLPAFAEGELRDYRWTYVLADNKDRNNFPDLEALSSADLVVLSVRRRTLPAAQLALIRKYLDSGKPLIGIRTASHAFSLRHGPPPDGHVAWPEFDQQVLGGNYQGHHSNGGPSSAKTLVSIAPSAKDHPILAGCSADELSFSTSLYKNTPLVKGTTVLLIGHVDNIKQSEPVAWTYERSGRVFYTSLGGDDDFQNASFRIMLKNAIRWALSK
jgi:type 1 glutamine amidotransferase/nicotinamidase-related amidase